MRQRLFCVALIVVLGNIAGGTGVAGPIVHVGEEVRPTRRIAVEKIDHSTWNTLLQKYVDEQGYVNYTQWKDSAADQKQLDAYLNHLSAASFSAKSSRKAQLAFWINAYNAVTVKGILREYPTTSIRNHTAKIYGYNIWKELLLNVSGKDYSLEMIENDLLRKMDEPRIHFAIVCASVGCPKLLNQAYTATELDDQLTANATSFFADETKFSASSSKGTIAVSPILKWYASDFGPDTASQMKSIAPYVPKSARSLAAGGKARVSYLEYDWGLNDQVKLRASTR